MINIIIDHSYADDYFMISEISVNIKDPTERERVEYLVRKYNLEGSLEDPNNSLSNRIADMLQVDVSIIDIDTEEVDLM
ncbi:hypothetical protein [Aquibacillus kalidii]|uniref:hypothetical protein n=1 Tax=Aquibacillus kalidii TaxID=2762597 RepID=UPI001645CD73|nr:hypothetical protein [Aquibacillus kalidii]